MPLLHTFESEADVLVPEGYLVNYLDGRSLLKATSRENVRQKSIRYITRSYDVSVEDIDLNYSIQAGNVKLIADIAVFRAGADHTAANLERVVICKPEPPHSKTVNRIRDYDQAHEELLELSTIMQSLPNCRYAMWTNGLEFFYLSKTSSGLPEPAASWPNADGNAWHVDPRPADPEMLRTAFRRCHDYIHGNEGMPKDAAFWQFLYLIFCKLHDEGKPKDSRSFFAGPIEPFTAEGQLKIRTRIEALFKEVKQQYHDIFRGNEEIILSDRALSFMVSELSKFDFARTPIDAKGVAYQEIVGANLRGDRGQYFTPRGAIRLLVEMVHPRPDDVILDPACGTGGFLVAVLEYVLIELGKTEDDNSKSRIFKQYAGSKVFGCDFDPFLIRAAQMNMVMAGDGKSHLYNINSLEFPSGTLRDIGRAARDIPLGSVDIILTNPPFGADIPITDPAILEPYDLAHEWVKIDDHEFSMRDVLKRSVAPEVLFIERCLEWLKPGGKLGIVLPDGILGNPAAEYIRWWIMERCWVIAVVDLPVEVFIVEANVNILTSLVILQKKTPKELAVRVRDRKRDYEVFMAIAERVGYDRRGSPIFKRNADGKELTVVKEELESVETAAGKEMRPVRKVEKVVDNDLPSIATQFDLFVKRHVAEQPFLRTFMR
ncbi:MAG TPA: N-6 DNA methylase [Fimbriimonas sp.]|nr:N-6 DNA methylase [Fimbriimonas sp.]